MRLYSGKANRSGRISRSALKRVLALGSTREIVHIRRWYLPPEAGHAVCQDCGEPFQFTRRGLRPAPSVCGPCGRARYEATLAGRRK